MGSAKNRNAKLAKSGKKPFSSVCLDWLAFTKHCVENQNDVMFEITRTFKTWRERRQFTHGYEGIDLAVDGSLTTRGSHVRVELNGKAMQYVRYGLGFSDEAVLQFFLSRGFEATRLDGAVDSADKALNPLIALRYWQRGNVRCESSTVDFRLPKLPGGEQIFPKDGAGMTTYFGSRKSERLIRFYDKRFLMLKQTGELPTDLNGEELDHLTRIEMQCRRAQAHLLARQICQYGIRVVPCAIAGYLSFLDPRDSRKRRRRNVARWWERIIGDVRHILSIPHTVSSPDQAMFWIKRQVTPTLKMMREFAPDKFKELLEDWTVDYEAQPARVKKWETWAKIRAERKALLAELEQIEKDDDAMWRVQKQLDASSPTVNDLEV